jgi:Predicted oxidoreductases (related to aryl-alcohol dehydrogenases)
MERRRIARTKVEVTTLGFGAAPIGNLYTAVDAETAHAAVNAAWDGGVRYFDTAPHYGLGLSERRLGAALAEHRRDEIVVSTKVGRLLVPNATPTGSDLEANGFVVSDTLTRLRDYSADGVRRSIEASLTRLGLDRIDIALIHDSDEHMRAAIDEAVPALVALRDQGVVAAIGAGMNHADTLLRFVTETDIDVVMVAGRWTIIDRSAHQLMSSCLHRGISVLAAAPFNSGLLSRTWPPDGAFFDYGPAPEDVLRLARALAAECQRWGVTLPHAAIQFPLQHPAVASVVAGIRTPAQAAGDVAWAISELPEAAWEAFADVVRQSEIR